MIFYMFPSYTFFFQKYRTLLSLKAFSKLMNKALCYREHASRTSCLQTEYTICELSLNALSQTEISKNNVLSGGISQPTSICSGGTLLKIRRDRKLLMRGEAKFTNSLSDRVIPHSSIKIAYSYLNHHRYHVRSQQYITEKVSSNHSLYAEYPVKQID